MESFTPIAHRLQQHRHGSTTSNHSIQGQLCLWKNSVRVFRTTQQSQIYSLSLRNVRKASLPFPAPTVNSMNMVDE